VRLLRGPRRRDGDPVATYAAVLDGAHLWLEVDGASGPLSLRAVGSRESVDLGKGPHDLTGLAADAYDVVVGRTRVGVAADLQRPLTRSPVAPDGVSRWEPQDDGGLLRLVRTRVAPTAVLDTVELRGDRIHLRLRPPSAVAVGSHLLLLDQDDAVLATLPVTAHHGGVGEVGDGGERVEALVGVDDLPAGWFGMLRVALGGSGADALRVRRRDDDLRDANHAVLLPELHDDGRLRARLRWNPDGLLALRSLDPALDPSLDPALDPGHAAGEQP